MGCFRCSEKSVKESEEDKNKNQSKGNAEDLPTPGTLQGLFLPCNLVV